MRDKSRDGWMNRIETFFLTGFPGLWRFIMKIPPIRRWANKRIIGRAAGRAPCRPHAFSSMPIKGGDVKTLMAGYTSWESLTDRNWFSRHLPPRKLPIWPDLKTEMADLYKVRPSGPRISEDSTVLFLSFAQWFTDGFLMTDTGDRRRTHTSHHIDLNPLYGLTREQTQAIRIMSETPGQKGRLKFETINGEIYAPKMYDDTGTLKPEFAVLRQPLNLDGHFQDLEKNHGHERAQASRQEIFAFAGERANSTPFTAMLNTLFLREHNRLAGILEAANTGPEWDDERIFQTARNINIVELIKIVVEEYINHISPYHFKLTADPKVCWREYWNKPNWIPVEFNLLYRWHSLVPDHFVFSGTPVSATETGFAHSYLTNVGVAALAESAAHQRAWEVGLFNTAPFLLQVELGAIKQSRDHLIASYNDYREIYGFPRVTRFEQITGDPQRVDALRRLYKEPDNIEFFVGLFAEDVGAKSAVPPLIGRMVALDAFSQALTNPLLSEYIYNETTFSKEGLLEIAATGTLQDVINRNLAPGQKPISVSMEYRAAS